MARDPKDYKLDVEATIEVTGHGLSTNELSCRLVDTGEQVLLTVPPDMRDRVLAALEAGGAARKYRAGLWEREGKPRQA